MTLIRLQPYQIHHMKWVKHDGGRAAAGLTGKAGDCVARSIAIATGRPYAEVHQALAYGTGTQKRSTRTGKRGFTADAGINTGRKWFKDYMAHLGFRWVSTMKIGQGCKVHLRDGELPKGRLAVSVSKHMTCVIDGVIYDAFNPDRGGTRCVYGYWKLDKPQADEEEAENPYFTICRI
jgi:hypothetical protein